jgi:hypothetical protein
MVDLGVFGALHISFLKKGESGGGSIFFHLRL